MDSGRMFEVGGDAASTSTVLAKAEEVARQPGQGTLPVGIGVMCVPFAFACVLCVELSCVVGVGRRGGERVARLMSRQTSPPCTVDAGIAVGLPVGALPGSTQVFGLPSKHS